MARAIRVEGRLRIRLGTRPRGKVQRPRAGDKARAGLRSTRLFDWKMFWMVRGLKKNGINLKALSALWGDDLSEGVVYHYGFSGWGGAKSAR